MKLILFGGIQGVGKTTLLSWLSAEFPGRLAFLDAGELFRRHHYLERRMSSDEVEDLIAARLAALPADAVAVAHWHFAVRRPVGFIPQISHARLKRLAESGMIEQAVLLKAEAPVEMVLARRALEASTKKRALSCAEIEREAAAEEAGLAAHRSILAAALGADAVGVVRLTNVDLETAKTELGSFFKAILTTP